MFEKSLIEQCSSTLAGLKPANLFSYTGPDRELVPEYIRFWNQKLNPRGVFLTALHCSGTRILVYVYRRGALSRELARPGAAEASFEKSRDLSISAKIRRFLFFKQGLKNKAQTILLLFRTA